MPKIRELLERLLTGIWYKQSAISSFIAILLSPLSLIYFAISQHNKNTALATLGLSNTAPTAAKAKVIVIGNITAGGTGKTPFLIALAKQLAGQGFKLAIISRGHAGQHLKAKKPMAHYVTIDSDPQWVGDEPLLVLQTLIANGLNTIPVIVSRKRQLALEQLNEQDTYDIVLSDDGLQHYALQRDIEIVLVDAARGFGNHKLLPAGPLREPLARLINTDLIVFNGKASEQLQTTVGHFTQKTYAIETVISHLHSLDGALSLSLDEAEQFFSDIKRFDLVAGIGNPKRFFDAVRVLLGKAHSSAAIPMIVEHPFVDHYSYSLSDLEFTNVTAASKSVIIMTAKDAVKCSRFADELNVPVLVVDVDIILDQAILTAINQQLAKL